MYYCFVIVLEMNAGIRVTPAMHALVKCVTDVTPNGQTKYIHVHNDRNVPFYDRKYLMTDLNGVWTWKRWCSLRFKEPRHQVLVQGDDPIRMHAFLRNLLAFVDIQNNPEVKVSEWYDPRMLRFISPTSFARNTFGYYCLSQLILEGCVIPKLMVGSYPIVHISLSKSTLGTNKTERDYFFDWMTVSALINSLKVLELNECNLDSLPFEIMYLKVLETLSVTSNNLTTLPHYLDKLRTLKHFFANNNKLKFLPGSLQSIWFFNLNVDGNDFECYTRENQRCLTKIFEPRPINYPVCFSLYHLAFISFSTNFVVKRQYLPSSMWDLFDKLVHCKFCQKLVMSDSCFEVYDVHLAKTVNFCNNNEMPWQYFECKHACSANIEYLDLKLACKDLLISSFRRKLLRSQLFAMERLL